MRYFTLGMTLVHYVHQGDYAFIVVIGFNPSICVRASCTDSDKQRSSMPASMLNNLRHTTVNQTRYISDIICSGSNLKRLHLLKIYFIVRKSPILIPLKVRIWTSTRAVSSVLSSYMQLTSSMGVSPLSN
jgi:hypothetical protein